MNRSTRDLLADLDDARSMRLAETSKRKQFGPSVVEQVSNRINTMATNVDSMLNSGVLQPRLALFKSRIYVY